MDIPLNLIIYIFCKVGWGEVTIHDVGICIDELLNTDGGFFFVR